ncbi:hypothetical protein HYH03_014282 [Edaphochlamys debaryana]|uniref:Uncharacterized protein n=1 Tax=Edaphochlamys debaryana TaxID=47281 RepID=A0A835XNA7_9CHLO|nr:hypothetical protein HYH03_014282 [Edaphochlamys debaryana]|eukprot:KAG2487036.1 hypothetical protein HYH03_014282 [Edaphochlamys debaryana]
MQAHVSATGPPPPAPFVFAPNGVATVLPPDLRPECAHFDFARNVLVSRFDSGVATGWRDVQFGAGRDQALGLEEVEGGGTAAYGSGFLDLTSAAGVLPTDLPNWSTDPAAPFTVIVVQSLRTQAIDWSANYLIAELSCSGAASGLVFGTREAFLAGVDQYSRAFHTSKPVPVEPGWNLHAFVRRKGGTEGAYYCAGASGGIALREAFTNQPPISVGPDRLTVGTSLCMGTAKSRALLGAVLVYNRALSVTDLKRVHESYAPRFTWTRGGGSLVCLPGISMRARTVECGKWTKGGPGETRLQSDCDGDGLLDAVLVDASGARGVALSSKGCSTEDADTGYPDAPTAACPALFVGLCPKPPGDWCPGGEVLQLDCGSCAYPAGSPCNEGRMLSVDCDNDGVRDWVCLGEGGQRGVVPSRRACDASPAVSGYPAALDRACPVLFVNKGDMQERSAHA